MEFIDKITSNKNFSWWSSSGLLVGVIAAVVVASLLNQIFENKIAGLLSLAFLVLSWIALWMFKNWLPKAEKGKVGVLVCIHCKDKDVDERVREDFTSSLQRSLEIANNGKFADIIIVPYHMASRNSDIDSAIDLAFKKRCHFLLFGGVKKRGNRHIMDTIAYVRHKRLDPNSQSRFKEDISSAWVKRYEVENAEEKYQLFEMTSEAMSMSSKFIIGLAALISHDLDTAESLFCDVAERIKNKQYPDLPITRTIKKKIRDNLNSIYSLRARWHLKQWGDTKETRHIERMRENVDKYSGIYMRNAEFYTLKSIAEVILNNNILGAVKLQHTINRADRTTVWYLNIGFLHACLNNEKEALSAYSTAIAYNDASSVCLTLDVISEIEDFICWYYNSVMTNSILTYLLGLLNENFKGDKSRALQDYSEFVKNPKSVKYPAALKLANKKLSVLDKVSVPE